MTGTTICIFARPPLPGKTKTRLISLVGSEAAAAIARAMLDDVISIASQIKNAQVVISASESFVIGNPVPVWLQPEGDLGFRLEKTVQRALRTSERAIAVGADTPGLAVEMLQQAAECLCASDAVIGPAQDGGYYLIGLRRCPDGLFENIRWSCPNTLNDTLERFAKFNLKYSVALPWFDLDTPQDLVHVYSVLESGVNVGSNLASVLESLRGRGAAKIS